MSDADDSTWSQHSWILSCRDANSLSITTQWESIIVLWSPVQCSNISPARLLAQTSGFHSSCSFGTSFTVLVTEIDKSLTDAHLLWVIPLTIKQFYFLDASFSALILSHRPRLFHLLVYPSLCQLPSPPIHTHPIEDPSSPRTWPNYMQLQNFSLSRMDLSPNSQPVYLPSCLVSNPNLLIYLFIYFNIFIGV